MRDIAFLGLGAMGARMAARLPGDRLRVWNRNPDRAVPLLGAGADQADSPAAASHGARVAFAMVRDDTAARAVWLGAAGALAGLAPGSVAIECSTVTPGWIAELGAAAAARGVTVIDAPVLGSRPQAEAGQLIWLAGGDAGAIEAVEPLLLAMGSAVHRTGALGTGAAMKLAVNALFATQVALLAEALGTLERQGVGPDAATAILGALPTTSPAAKAALASITARAFAPLFPVELVEKDLSYFTQAAAALGAETPVGGEVRRVFQRAIEAGYGADHLTGIARLYSA